MSTGKKICVAGDHAGFELKKIIKAYLEEKGYDVHDCGALEYDREDDYPPFAADLAAQVTSGACPQGVLFCGTGVGASIAANRHKGVRAALCFTPEMATLGRAHNNANVLVLGARTTSVEKSKEILNAFLAGDFEGGRHERRVKQLDELG